MRIVLCGNRGGTNVGGAFERAAIQQGHQVFVLEPSLANSRSLLIQRFNWWVLGRRPARLGWFDQQLLRLIESSNPDVVVSVGISPPSKGAANRIRASKIRLLNYLTDDPWQRHLRASWFIRALPNYESVFSTKREIMTDLQRAGVKHASFLPFAYDPELHHCWKDEAPDANSCLGCDVLFAGGGDADRFPFLRALVEVGLDVAIYGGEWESQPTLRQAWRGHANPGLLRQATASAKVCLCLVRRANRDGHVMRSFEIAAMRGCLLMEDTLEHREIFGPDGECATYFRSIDEMLTKAKLLLRSPEERHRLAAAAHHRICTAHHTYGDRLRTMLGT